MSRALDDFQKLKDQGLSDQQIIDKLIELLDTSYDLNLQLMSLQMGDIITHVTKDLAKNG